MLKKAKDYLNLWIEERSPTAYELSEELKLIVSFESLSLFARYLLIFIIIGLYIAGISSENYAYFLIFLGSVMLHNLITHLVFYLNKPILFTSPLSYLLHLISITASIIATGQENSPIFVGYIIFQFIYPLYSKGKPHPIITTLFILILYNTTIISIWGLKGIKNASFLLITQNGIILFCGVIALILTSYYQRVKGKFFQMEQEVVYSQNIIKSIIESIKIPILIFDDNEIIIEANSHLLTLTEESKDSLIGKRLRGIFFDDLMISEHLLLLKSTGEINLDATLITEDGTEIPVQMIARSFYRNNNRFYLGLLIDKREEKKLQEIAIWVRKQKEELEEKITRIRELQLGFSESLVPRIFTNLTTLKNSIKMLLSETFGSINEKQRSILECARRALIALEEDLGKEIYIQEIQMSNPNR